MREVIATAFRHTLWKNPFFSQVGTSPKRQTKADSSHCDGFPSQSASQCVTVTCEGTMEGTNCELEREPGTPSPCKKGVRGFPHTAPHSVAAAVWHSDLGQR